MCISMSPTILLLFLFLTHKYTLAPSVSPTARTVLTDEPCVGGQAGLVIVLVGTGAHCGRVTPAVYHEISQPRPAQQNTKHSTDRERGRVQSQTPSI